MSTLKVTLREEIQDRDSRYLWARLDDDGNLVIEGQDLGPATVFVSSDGEYEWATTVPAEFIPALLALLDAPRDSSILDILGRHWAGPRSYELERRLRESDIPVRRWSF
jgi:hypothetical protein